MANFRCERLFVMIDEPIPGLDHLRAVDPEQFAWHGTDREAELEGLTPLGDFTYAPFDRKRWRPAAEGLKTVRGLIQLYTGWVSRGHNPYERPLESITETLDVLSQVEAVLDAADSRDRRFCLAAKDLG